MTAAECPNCRCRDMGGGRYDPEPLIVESIPKVGTRVVATLRSGGVLSGNVTNVVECITWTRVTIGGLDVGVGVTSRIELTTDVVSWFEVTT